MKPQLSDPADFYQVHHTHDFNPRGPVFLQLADYLLFERGQDKGFLIPILLMHDAKGKELWRFDLAEFYGHRRSDAVLSHTQDQLAQREQCPPPFNRVDSYQRWGCIVVNGTTKTRLDDDPHLNTVYWAVEEQVVFFNAASMGLSKLDIQQNKVVWSIRDFRLLGAFATEIPWYHPTMTTHGWVYLGKDPKSQRLEFAFLQNSARVENNILKCTRPALVHISVDDSKQAVYVISRHPLQGPYVCDFYHSNVQPVPTLGLVATFQSNGQVVSFDSQGKQMSIITHTTPSTINDHQQGGCYAPRQQNTTMIPMSIYTPCHSRIPLQGMISYQGVKEQITLPAHWVPLEYDLKLAGSWKYFRLILQVEGWGVTAMHFCDS